MVETLPGMAKAVLARPAHGKDSREVIRLPSRLVDRGLQALTGGAMADDKQQNQAPEEEVDDAVADATSDTVKIPDEEESQPANVEGSDAKLP